MRIVPHGKSIHQEPLVSTESPAERLRHQYDLLNWAVQALARQSAPIRASIEHTATVIVTALLSTTYQCTVDLPTEIISDSSQVVKLTKPITIRVGGLLQRMRRISCHEELLNKLATLAEDSDPATAHLARLVKYCAAVHILNEHLPSANAIAQLRAFDHKKQRLCSTDEEAEAIIDQMLMYVEQLRIAEQLYAGCMASEVYTEKRAILLQQITEQGRAFAHMQTLRLIEELQQAWQGGTLGGGLMLFIPYMDEHNYQMSKFAVEVMPNARIPFRPDFVVSACRLAEREVRQNSRYAQSTRWQLLAQLDLITQAFDTKLDTSAESSR
jgi:hypothetical protein